MTHQLIAPVIPSAVGRRSWPAGPDGRRPSLPLAAPLAIPLDAVYGMSRIDASGRLTSQAVSHVPDWQPGDRLTLTAGTGADRPLAGRQGTGTRGRFAERRQARQAHDKARERY